MSPPLPPGVRLAPLRACHAAAVFAVQRAIYPSRLLESAVHIVDRARQFPSGSFVALATRSGGSADAEATEEDVVGYAQAYPWPAAAAAVSPPSLCDSDAPAVIARACAAATAVGGEGGGGETLLFVHEVSVWRQGVGLGRALMEAAEAFARRSGCTRVKDVVLHGILEGDLR
jgi:GNAT superfamily N-acetyltransferase